MLKEFLILGFCQKIRWQKINITFSLFSIPSTFTNLLLQSLSMQPNSITFQNLILPSVWGVFHCFFLRLVFWHFPMHQNVTLLCIDPRKLLFYCIPLSHAGFILTFSVLYLDFSFVVNVAFLLLFDCQVDFPNCLLYQLIPRC